MSKKPPKALRKTLVGLTAGAATAFTIFTLSQIGGLFSQYLEQLERVFYDLTFKVKFVHSGRSMDESTQELTSDSTVEPRIVIADIDERSLARLGAYNSWPRTHHARVVDFLAEGGAASITFDILFKSADFGVNGANQAITVMQQIYPQKQWQNDFDAFRSAYNHDSILVSSVRRAGNVVVCATVAPRTTYEHKSQWEPLSSALWQDIIGTRGTLDPEQIPLQKVMLWDLLDNIFPELAQAAKYMGLVNVIPDDDGVHRREPLFHAYPNPKLAEGATPRYYPVIAIQTIAVLFGIEPRDIVVRPGEFVDLGKPLGIFRDSSGTLRSTYPHLTWPMIRALLQKRREIQELATGKGDKKILEITHQVIVSRNSEGQLSADINDAQTLSPDMISAILGSDILDTLLENPLDTLYHLTPSILLSSSDSLWKILDENAEEEVTITQYAIQVLRENTARIHALRPGDKVYLSANLELKYIPENGKLSSSFIILTPSVLEDLLTRTPRELEALRPGQMLRVGKPVRIPIDDRLRMLVNYTGRYNVSRHHRAFRQISYYDLIQRRIDPATLQGKIFILGSTAPALFDLISAPHESEYPAVLIHATILENILNGNFLQSLNQSKQFWIILGLALVSSIIANLMPPLIGAPLMILMILGYFLTGITYFDHGIYIGMARQILTIAASFLVIMLIRYIFEEREKRFLNNAFKSYISPELIDIMLESESRPSLGGSEGIYTAFFTDIAGFSTFSEAIGSPEKLVELLNEYLGVMTDILTKDRGTLDKYIGDAIVAIFGAPVPIEDHAHRACLVALKMQKALDDLRHKWKSEGDKWPPLVHKMRMRIGINTGPMVVGNMGSSMRMNYTMMGDTVNLAARLESVSKQYGVYILVSDETLSRSQRDQFLSRPIDLLVVVGKNEPVLCHELLALKQDATEDLENLLRLWHEARAAYLNMRWDEAIALFTRCLDLEPFHPNRAPGSKTTPSHVFIQRCLMYKEKGVLDKDGNPWPAGIPWDGVYIATSK